MPIFTGIGALIATVGSFFGASFSVGTFLLNAAVGVGLSLVSRLLAGTAAQNQGARVGGVQGKLQAAGDLARSFPLGFSVTAGSLVYANTWGKDGDTPNAYLTQVIAVSDLPTTLARIYANGVSTTILTGEAHADYGIPVEQYRKDGKDHLWIKFHDGTQTTADTFLSNSVASAERPWGPDRIGKGIAYAICTALINDELFTGFPQLRFELDGVRLYDPSRDDTAGGTGSQRWSDPSTWGGDGDNLPAVQAYNVLRGISYGGQWLYGLQGVSAAQLPSEAWINAINACRDPIEGASGLEPSYRAGMELLVSHQIGDTLDVLMTSSQGRLAEIGGTYKMRVGPPGAPVLIFTDEDIISTEEQTFTPFFGLSETVNGISASYPEPAEGWNMKVAPPLLRTDLEAMHGGRRLLSEIKFDAVPYVEQVQRLMKSALLEAQRARRHTYSLPPMFWLLEPGDVVAWSSARNGYVTKLFRVDGAIDKANLDVIVDLTEVDPSDYEWNHATDFRPVPRNPIVFVRPSAQAVLDWYAEGATVYDANGLARRPAILLEWNGTVTSDIAAIQFEVREGFGTMEIVHRGRSENVAAGSILVSQNLLPNTSYQVRGRYIPGNPRDTLWSDWIAVTTPNILVGGKDIVQSLLYQMQELQDEMDRRMSLVENGMQTSANSSARSIRDNTRLRGQTVKMVERVELRVDDAEASIEDVRELAVSNEGAIASLSTSVDARFATTNANVTMNAEAIAALDFSFGQYQVTVNAQLGNLSSRVTTNAQAIAALDYSFSQYKITVSAQLGNLTSSVTANATAIAQLDHSFSQYQVTVNAQLGNLSSSVTTNATAIAGIGAQYTVLLDANGYVSGTKQLNGGPGASSFTVLADFFQVAKPGVAGGAPVPVITLGTVNGVQKLALRGDMLADGTITARNILAGSITADKIQANSIGTNQLAVGGVDITNLIAGAATQVTSHDGGALSLTAPGTLFDLVSSGP
ncbi:tail protein, partial [Afipia sp. P52-10]|uniref:phage tail protein n=1 Tax=Afipia sp. P52-10 TaxID=1429916 RepID=UPI0003DF4048